MPYWVALSWSGAPLYFGTRVQDPAMAITLLSRLPTIAAYAYGAARPEVVAHVNMARVPGALPPRFAAIASAGGLAAFRAVYTPGGWGYVSAAALNALVTEWTNGGPLSSTSNLLPGFGIDSYT